MTAAGGNRKALLTSCAFMLTGAGLTVQDLAKHMGVRLQPAPMALAPKPRPSSTDKPRRREALDHAGRHGGVCVSELMALMGLAEQTAWQYLDDLHQAQQVIRVKVPGVRGTRFFAAAEAASAWVAGLKDIAAENARQAQAMVDARQARRERDAAEQQARAARQADRLAARAAKAALPKPEPKSPFSKAKPKKATKPVHPILIGDAIETAATRRVVDATKRPSNRVEAAPALPPDPRYPSFASVRYGSEPTETRA